MLFLDYIRTELLALIPVLCVFGAGLKKSNLPDKRIPLCLGLVSVLLCGTWVMATTDITTFKEVSAALFTALTQGLLIAGASVYANQIYRQSKKDE